MKEYDVIHCDVLVIGGGAAGTRAAIEAVERGLDVVIVTRGTSQKSGCTNSAGGIISAAFGHTDPLDNPSMHFGLLTNGLHLDEGIIDFLVKSFSYVRMTFSDKIIMDEDARNKFHKNLNMLLRQREIYQQTNDEQENLQVGIKLVLQLAQVED